jgi:hypothetical protein
MAITKIVLKLMKQMGARFHGRWRGPATIVNNKPVPSSERALDMNKPITICQ